VSLKIVLFNIVYSVLALLIMGRVANFAPPRNSSELVFLPREREEWQIALHQVFHPHIYASVHFVSLVFVCILLW
jgi:hypothetical protein